MYSILPCTDYRNEFFYNSFDSQPVHSANVDSNILLRDRRVEKRVKPTSTPFFSLFKKRHNLHQVLFSPHQPLSTNPTNNQFRSGCEWVGTRFPSIQKQGLCLQQLVLGSKKELVNFS